MDRGLPPESLNKVLLDVALQKHDQSRVATVSSTQSVPSNQPTTTTSSMPSDTNNPAHSTQQQTSMQHLRNTPHTEKQTTTTTITTAAASTTKAEGSLVPGGQILYQSGGSYTHSNLPTQFSTAPNTSGKGPSYVLDSHLHNITNMAASSGNSPLYTNLAAVSKNYGIGEAHSYNGALSHNKLLSTQAFNNTQTQGYNSSQSYNNNMQSYNNATHDNLHVYNKERLNISPKPAMSNDYTLPKDYNMPKDFKAPKDYNDSKDYKNAAKDYNTGKGNQKDYKACEGTLAVQSSGNPVRSINEMQKYILLSPVLGPKPVLLSPMYDKADQSNQARFVIVPMDSIESNTRRSSCCPILPTASSSLLAIEDFTSCQLLQEEAKELVSRRTEEQEEVEEEGGILHKTQDTTMQMLTHSRQEIADKRSQIPICDSLQQNNLMPGTRGPPTMPRDHHMPDLLYNNKVNHPCL